jgi:hypothetical protein
MKHRVKKLKKQGRAGSKCRSPTRPKPVFHDLARKPARDQSDQQITSRLHLR